MTGEWSTWHWLFTTWLYHGSVPHKPWPSHRLGGFILGLPTCGVYDPFINGLTGPFTVEPPICHKKNVHLFL